MSVDQIDTRHLFEPQSFPASHYVSEPRKRRQPIQHDLRPPVTYDEETRLVAKGVIWMVVLTATPLLLFHIVNFIYPNFLWIPIAPN